MPEGTAQRLLYAGRVELRGALSREGYQDPPVCGPGYLRKLRRRAPGGGCADRQGYSDGRGGAGGLRGDDGGGCGDQHRRRRAGDIGGGVRVRRRGAELHTGSGDLRCDDDNRGGHARQQAGHGRGVRRNPQGERLEGRPGGADSRADRRQGGPLRVRGDRPGAGAVPTEHPVHTAARGDRVGGTRPGPDAGHHRRAGPDAGEDGHRLNVRLGAPADRVPEAVGNVQGG